MDQMDQSMVSDSAVPHLTISIDFELKFIKVQHAWTAPGHYEPTIRASVDKNISLDLQRKREVVKTYGFQIFDRKLDSKFQNIWHTELST